MAVEKVTERQILEELNGLESSKWPEVRDFIAYLKYRAALEAQQPPARELTARELLRSELVGLWADRQDIQDSQSFARRLRQQAEHRAQAGDDTA